MSMIQGAQASPTDTQHMAEINVPEFVEISSADESSTSDSSDGWENENLESWNGKSVPRKGETNNTDLRILAANRDGSIDWTDVLTEARERDCQVLQLVDTEKPSGHKATKQLLKEHFAHNASLGIFGGLQQMFGRTIGGCITAVGKGWSARTVEVSDDPKQWGRFALTKLQGKAGAQLWLVQVYVCRLNKASPESYYNMQLQAMQQYEKETRKRLARTPSGDLCPHLQLQQDLEKVLGQAAERGAAVTMVGDFNEHWKDNGSWKQWAKSEMRLTNVLQDVPNTGGNTTCFPSNGQPSDIDWVLCTPTLAKNKLITAGVLLDKMDASAHCAIFITIKAREWLGLTGNDIKRAAKHQYSQNYIKGDEAGKKVRKYQQYLVDAWEKHSVELYSWQSEQAMHNWRDAPSQPATKKQELRRVASSHLEHVNKQIITAYQTALNKMQHTYATGKKHKPIYGGPPMLEVRKLCTLGRKLQTMWQRRKSQLDPFDGNQQKRGQNRGGRREADRGANPSMQELRQRVRAYFRRLNRQKCTKIQKRVKEAEQLLSKLQTSGGNKMARRVRHWDEIMAEIGLTTATIAPKLQLKAREHAVAEHAARKGQRKYDSRTKKLRHFLNAASETPERSKAIEKIEVDGKIISDPKEMARELCSNYEEWFGKGREFWYVNKDGTYNHPLMKRDERAEVLCQALLDGKYDDVAGPGEELPQVMINIQEQLRYKIITKGPRAGQRVSPEDMQELLEPWSPQEFMDMQSSIHGCKHPGATNITKPALRYTPASLWYTVGLNMYLADEIGHNFTAWLRHQLWLIEKEPGNPSLKLLRPIWFMEEMLKFRETLVESRITKLTEKLGLLEEEQSGFRTNRDTGNSIFSVSQTIEEAWVKRRELWVLLADQEKAFDTLENFVGKMLAARRMGVPKEVLDKQVAFDEAVLAEIITAHGGTGSIMKLSAEEQQSRDASMQRVQELWYEYTSDATEQYTTEAQQTQDHLQNPIPLLPPTADVPPGYFKIQRGGLQGAPASPNKWNRFYDLVICVQKMIRAGTIAKIEHEDGDITFSAEAFADDLLAMGGDNANIIARGEALDQSCQFSGGNIKALKTILTALVRDENGDLREVKEEEAPVFTNTKTGAKVRCAIATTDERLRYLGWFTCMDGNIDESFNQCWEECNIELAKLERNLWSGHEVEIFIKIKTLRRILYRLGYSSTGEDAIGKFQVLYNKLYRSKSRMIRNFANNLMYSPEKYGGLEWLHFWSEISVDRTCKLLRHGNDAGKMAKIFEAAERRSAEQHQTTTPPLESKMPLPWDGTILGRTKEWLQQTGVSIQGGRTDGGYREHDVSIIEGIHKKSELKLVIAGCQKSGIFWKSQMLAETGNTWSNEFQFRGKYGIGSKEQFSWTNYRTTTKGTRVAVPKTNNWELWADKAKKAVMEQSNTPPGKFWAHCTPELLPFDVVLCSDDQLPKIVVRQISNTAVEVLETQLTSAAKISPNETNGSIDLQGWKWEFTNIGASTAMQMQNARYTTIAEPPLVLQRNNLQRISAQYLPRRVGYKKFRKPQLNDALEQFEEAEIGILGGVFFRIPVGIEATEQAESVTGRWQQRSTQLNNVQAARNTTVSMDTFVGIGNAGQANQQPIRQKFPEWRATAQQFQNPAVLTGGDGSRKYFGDEPEAAFGFGVYGIGENSVEHWKTKTCKDVKVLASGGNSDWAASRYRQNTRGETMHLLAILHIMLELGLSVLHAVDYTGVKDNWESVQYWGTTAWANASDRDLWKAILHYKQKWKQAGLSFTVFHNQAHPERYAPDVEPKNYTALMRVAVLSDNLATAAMQNRRFEGKQPDLPGQEKWKLFKDGCELVGPYRQELQKITANGKAEKYFKNNRHGKLHVAFKLTEWSALQRFTIKRWTGFSKLATTRYLYDQWQTNAYQAKRNMRKDVVDEDASACKCGQHEDQWHILSECTCKERGYVEIRQRFSEQRMAMSRELGLKAVALSSIKTNLELKPDGTYPEHSKASMQWSDMASDLTQALQEVKDVPGYWFQKGLMPKSVVNRSRDTLGVTKNRARNWAFRFFELKRDEAHQLWKRRNDDVHGKGKKSKLCWQELRAQVRRLVLADRKAGRKTPTDQELRRMKTKQLHKYVKDEEARQRNRYESSSVTTLLTRQALRIAEDLSEEEWNFDGSATAVQAQALEEAWDKYNRLAQHQQTAQQKSTARQRSERGRRRALVENRAARPDSTPRIDVFLESLFDEQEEIPDTDKQRRKQEALARAQEYADADRFILGTASAAEQQKLAQLWETFNAL